MCSYKKLEDVTSKKAVVVLPAFETAPKSNETLAHQLAGQAAMLSKASLKKLEDKSEVYQFARFLYAKVSSRGPGWLCCVHGLSVYSFAELSLHLLMEVSVQQCLHELPFWQFINIAICLQPSAAKRSCCDADAPGHIACWAPNILSSTAVWMLQGHRATDYDKWFKANELYDIEYSAGYEPWFIIDRFLNPFYDASFRGYGWNKVAHVLNVHGAK